MDNVKEACGRCQRELPPLGPTQQPDTALKGHRLCGACASAFYARYDYDPAAVQDWNEMQEIVKEMEHDADT